MCLKSPKVPNVGTAAAPAPLAPLQPLSPQSQAPDRFAGKRSLRIDLTGPSASGDHGLNIPV